MAAQKAAGALPIAVETREPIMKFNTRREAPWPQWPSRRRLERPKQQLRLEHPLDKMRRK
jgi:hypothetical protein